MTDNECFDTISKFLIHMSLYYAQIYPEKTFYIVKACKNLIPVTKSPSLNEYIDKALNPPNKIDLEYLCLNFTSKKDDNSNAEFLSLQIKIFPANKSSNTSFIISDQEKFDRFNFTLKELKKKWLFLRNNKKFSNWFINCEYKIPVNQEIIKKHNRSWIPLNLNLCKENENHTVKNHNRNSVAIISDKIYGRISFENCDE